MDENAREALEFALEAIKDMADSIENWANNIELAMAYGDREFPEDVELVLNEVRNAVGDGYGAMGEAHDYILH